MFDKKSDYAINKKDLNAIVFKTVTGTYICLHREDFLSEDEFLKWKAWSDEDYRMKDIEYHSYAKHIINLETTQATSPSPELLLSEWYDRLNREQYFPLLLEGIDTCLSETHRRRLLKYYFEGMTEVEIAMSEDVSQSKISESIRRAKKNLKKFFNKAV